MEEYIEKRVEARLEQEIDELFDRLERKLPADEFRRVLEIAAEEERRRA